MSERPATTMIVETAIKVNHEKRKSTRVTLPAKVTIKTDTQIIEGHLVNLSLHGAFVTSDELVEVGRSVVINIFDSTSSRSLSEIDARVVRVDGNGMGLQFE